MGPPFETFLGKLQLWGFLIESKPWNGRPTVSIKSELYLMTLNTNIRISIFRFYNKILSFREDTEQDYDEEVEPSESEVKQDEKQAKQYKRIISETNDFFPGLYVAKELIESREMVKPIAEKGVLISYDRKDSWVINPPPTEKDDSLGVWDQDTTFPNLTGSWSITPMLQGKRIKVIDSVPFVFQDKELDDFFNAKNLVQKFKVSLPNKVFDKPSVPIGRFVNYHVIDSFSRQCLLENLLGDRLLGAVLDLINSTLKDWNNLDKDSLFGRMQACKKTLGMGFIMSQRCRQYIVAIYTSNKIKFRNYILDLSVGSEETKRVLKGSSLFSGSLFGELPESFKRGVDAAYASGRPNDTILKIRTMSKAQGGPSKRGQNFGNGPFNKRPRADYAQMDRAPMYKTINPRNVNDSDQYIFREDRKQSLPKNSSAARGKRGRGNYRGSRR